MTTRSTRGAGGRRSKGERVVLATRVPVAEADRVRELAERLGFTYSDTLAELARIGLQHVNEFHLRTPATQEALPLKAS